MTGLRVRVVELQSNIREKLVELLPNPSSQDVLEWLFLTMSPVEFYCDAVEPWQWQLGLEIGSFFIDLPHDLRCLLVSFLVSGCIALLKDNIYLNYYWYWKLRVYWHVSISFVIFLFLTVGLGLHSIAYCDGSNAFSPPLSPVQLPEEPVPQPEAPPVPQPVVIPQLAQPLISDDTRGGLLYNRYLLLNLGGNADLGRMVSIIDSQVIVERYVEAALVDDGFHPHSILSKYREIRGFLHAPQGELLSARTYSSYVTQIREHGTRESVPYRRIMRSLQNYDLFLEREL